MKQAAIYSPYWNTLGGGEKYVSEVVRAYSLSDYQVRVLWKDENLLDKLQGRYDILLNNCVVDASAYEKFVRASVYEKLMMSRSFDSFFVVSDGSLPTLLSKQVIVHLQVPFHSIKRARFKDAIRLAVSRPLFVVNSLFTKHVVDDEYGIDSLVVYPPAQQIAAASKENIILSVGRFDNAMHSKRHDVLIQAFIDGGFSGWKLVIAGGVLDNHSSLNQLKEMIKDRDDIELKTNIGWSAMKHLYATAPIYWHAAGYGLDEQTHPEKMEHFGISTVEAMSARAVPIVFAGGGLKEIVTHESDGYLWKTPEQLIAYTKTVMSDDVLSQSLSTAAQKAASLYSSERFLDEFSRLIS